MSTIDVEIDSNQLQFPAPDPATDATGNIPATDATGNTFVLYNPGRYWGVLVLVPARDGFADIGWSDPTSHFGGGKLAYYDARLEGPGPGARYAIRQDVNSCDPSCAGGAVSTVELHWDGIEYVPSQ